VVAWGTCIRYLWMVDGVVIECSVMGCIWHVVGMWEGGGIDGAVFSVGESCNVLLLGALGTGESWLADASGCIAEVGVAWLHKRGSPHSQLHTTISCNRTHHDHFTFTQIRCAHFRVLHLLYTHPLLQMYTAILQRNRTKPNPRGVFHYSADEDNYALQAERTMLRRARFQPGTPVPGLDYICQRANSS
jgi:hypothetical protein